jgi:EmrB/QacA subfamily drug resistance transporter
MCIGLGMLMVDMFAVNVALPTISRDFQAPLGLTEWVVSGYVFMLGVFPVITGRLGDIFGRRRVYLVGLGLFAGGAAASGLAISIEMLVASRVVQGAGAAVMMPGTLSIITQAFPLERRGLAIGIWGGVSGLGLIAGPSLGGLLVTLSGTWRAVFLIHPLLALAAVALALAFVRESRDESVPRSVDWRGVLTLAGGLFLLMLTINRGHASGWLSPPVLASAAGGLALLAAFVAIERRVRWPLIRLSLLRNSTLIAACVAAFFFSATVFGAMPYMSLFMQNFWGFSAFEGGLAFVPSTILVALLMPVSGVVGQRLGDRLRLMLMIAAGCVVLSAFLLTRLTPDSGYVDGMLPAFLVRGLGIGLFMAASSFAVVSSVSPAVSGLAAGLLTMSRQVGTAIGVALLGGIYVSSVRESLDVPLASRPEAAGVLDSAEHFVVDAPPPLTPVVEQAVLDGFVTLAVASVALAAVAAVACLFIRRLPRLDTSAQPVAPVLRGRPPNPRAVAACCPRGGRPNPPLPEHPSG